MTSKERVFAALNGNAADRVPVGPFIGFRAVEAVDADMRDYYTQGRIIAEAQYAMCREIGHDILVSAADTYYISEAFGMETVHHKNALPTVKQPLFSQLEEAVHLKVPDPETDGRMPVYLEAVDEMKRLVGNTKAIRGTGTGPFSLAAYMFGEENFLMMLAEIEYGVRGDKEKHAMHRILEITSDTSLAFLKAQIKRGVDIVYMGDSFASHEMISPALYREYAFPYHKKIFESVNDICRERDCFSLLHICGDNTKILDDFRKTGAGIIEIDQKVDLSAARSIVGPEVNLIGNLDPSGTLLQGSPDEVYDKSIEAMQKTHALAGHFILGSGCFVPLGTPVDNLKQMVKASEDFSR